MHVLLSTHSIDPCYWGGGGPIFPIEVHPRADNVWWRCAQYFVIISCSEIPRDNICMEHARCLGVLKHVVCLCKGCDGCCVFHLYCDAWSCKYSCMGSLSVSPCIYYMFVSCMHHVEVRNATLCMTCSLLMLVEDARGNHMEEAHSRAGRMTASEVAMSLSFCLPKGFPTFWQSRPLTYKFETHVTPT